MTIDLPVDFPSRRVEIIILPMEEKENAEQSLSDLLLEAPTLSNEELKKFDSVREWMSKWDVNEF